MSGSACSLSVTTPGRGAVVSTVIWGNRECIGWYQTVWHPWQKGGCVHSDLREQRVHWVISNCLTPLTKGRLCPQWSEGTESALGDIKLSDTPDKRVVVSTVIWGNRECIGWYQTVWHPRRDLREQRVHWVISNCLTPQTKGRLCPQWSEGTESALGDIKLSDTPDKRAVVSTVIWGNRECIGWYQTVWHPRQKGGCVHSDLREQRVHWVISNCLTPQTKGRLCPQWSEGTESALGDIKLSDTPDKRAVVSTVIWGNRECIGWYQTVWHPRQKGGCVHSDLREQRVHWVISNCLTPQTKGRLCPQWSEGTESALGDIKLFDTPDKRVVVSTVIWGNRECIGWYQTVWHPRQKGGCVYSDLRTQRVDGVISNCLTPQTKGRLCPQWSEGTESGWGDIKLFDTPDKRVVVYTVIWGHREWMGWYQTVWHPRQKGGCVYSDLRAQRVDGVISNCLTPQTKGWLCIQWSEGTESGWGDIKLFDTPDKRVVVYTVIWGHREWMGWYQTVWHPRQKGGCVYSDLRAQRVDGVISNCLTPQTKGWLCLQWSEGTESALGDIKLSDTPDKRVVVYTVIWGHREWMGWYQTVWHPRQKGGCVYSDLRAQRVDGVISNCLTPQTKGWLCIQWSEGTESGWGDIKLFDTPDKRVVVSTVIWGHREWMGWYQTVWHPRQKGGCVYSDLRAQRVDGVISNCLTPQTKGWLCIQWSEGTESGWGDIKLFDTPDKRVVVYTVIWGHREWMGWYQTVWHPRQKGGCVYSDLWAQRVDGVISNCLTPQTKGWLWVVVYTVIWGHREWMGWYQTVWHPRQKGGCVYSDLRAQRVDGVISNCLTPQTKGWLCIQWSEGTESGWGDIKLSDTPDKRVVVYTVIWGHREWMGWYQTVWHPRQKGGCVYSDLRAQRVDGVISNCLTTPDKRVVVYTVIWGHREWMGWYQTVWHPRQKGGCVYSDLRTQRVDGVISNCLTPQTKGWLCLQWSEGTESALGDIKLSDTPDKRVVVSTVIWGHREWMGWYQTVWHTQTKGWLCLQWSEGTESGWGDIKLSDTPDKRVVVSTVIWGHREWMGWYQTVWHHRQKGGCVYSDLRAQRVDGVISNCLTPQTKGWLCLQWSEGTESGWGDIKLSDTPDKRVVVSTVIWGHREWMGWYQTVWHPRPKGWLCIQWSEGTESGWGDIKLFDTTDKRVVVSTVIWGHREWMGWYQTVWHTRKRGGCVYCDLKEEKKSP